MKHRKLQAKYLNYIRGELSEREEKMVKQHLRNCPDCASEVKKLEQMRRLIKATGQPKLSDEYWNSYWERLEKKLPDEPLQVNLKTRLLSIFKYLSQNPAFLARIMIFIFFLASLLYMNPDRSVDLPTQIALKTELDVEELDLGRSEKAEETTAAGRKMLMKPSAPALGIKKHNITDETSGFTTINGESLSRKSELSYDSLTPQEANLRADREYAKAEEYFEDGKYSEAIPIYERFIEVSEDKERTLLARFQIGESYYQMGNYTDALSNFVIVANNDEMVKDVAKERKRSRINEAEYRYKGQSDLKYSSSRAEPVPGQKAGAKALSQLREEKDVIDRDELISQAIFRLAESYEYLGDNEKAIATYKKYLDRYPQGEHTHKAKQRIKRKAD
jgi:TolA-binding protein